MKGVLGIMPNISVENAWKDIEAMIEQLQSYPNVGEPNLAVEGLVPKCPECSAANIVWLYDHWNNYLFDCVRCGAQGWQTKEEFRQYRRSHKKQLFEQRIDKIGVFERDRATI